MLFRRKRKSDARVKKESAVKVEMKRVRGEPHGTHFRALHSDVDKFLDYVIGRVSLNNVFRMTEQPFADMGKQFIAGHLVDLNEWLSIAVIQVMIGERRELATAYPVYWGGDRKRVRVMEVYEWPIQIEVNIAAGVGETVVRYFATDFFMERERYLSGEVAEASIWMVGYGLRVNPYRDVKIKVERGEMPFKEVSLGNAEVLIPFEKGGVLDEYVVTGRVRGVERLPVLDEEIYMVRISNIPLGELDILVNKNNVKGEVKVGDMVEAVGWMEGKIPGGRWQTLR